MINVLSFRVLIFHDHVIINDTMIKYFPRKAKNTLDLSSSMLAVRSPTIRQNKGKTDHASFAIHTFGRYVSGKDSLINMFCPCLCNKNQQKNSVLQKNYRIFSLIHNLFSLWHVFLKLFIAAAISSGTQFQERFRITPLPQQVFPGPRKIENSQLCLFPCIVLLDLCT